MRKIIYITFFCCWGVFFSSASADTFTSDEIQIQGFLSDPLTRVFEDTAPSPIAWQSHRRYLQQGTHIAGGCRFSNAGTNPDGKSIVIREIAVNRYSCQSLVFEGILTERGEKAAKIYFDSSRKLGLTQQNADPSESGVSATAYGDYFNEGGATHEISRRTLFTDGNNSAIKTINSVAENILITANNIIGTVYQSLGWDFTPLPTKIEFSAVDFEVKHRYSEPAVPLDREACFYNPDNKKSAAFFGDTTISPGLFGWNVLSSYVCTATMIKYGSLPSIPNTEIVNGQKNSAGTAACRSRAEAQFRDSCLEYSYLYQSFEYYTTASATFENKLKIGQEPVVVFDCSTGTGLQVKFDNYWVYGNGRGFNLYSGAVNVTGPEENCSNNFARYEFLTNY